MSNTSPPLSLRDVRAANAKRLASVSEPLTAVFTGGTSGIGEYTLGAFAKYAAAGAGATIYLVGRKKASADRITAAHAALSNVRIHFVQVEDLCLLRDVDRCCEELARLLREQASTPRIDLLVMSHADFWLGKRRETPEGLDKLASHLYYSRIRFVHQLLPFLDATILPSARVISVYAGGLEDHKKDFYPEDLSLRDPKKFGFSSARNHVVHMTTMAFETIAQRHPQIGLVHIYPGLVLTPAFKNNPMPVWFKVTYKIVSPLLPLVALKPDVIADWVVGFTAPRFGGTQETGPLKEAAARATTGVEGGGAYSAKYDGATHGGSAAYERLRKDGFQEKNGILIGEDCSITQGLPELMVVTTGMSTKNHRGKHIEQQESRGRRCRTHCEGNLALRNLTSMQRARQRADVLLISTLQTHRHNKVTQTREKLPIGDRCSSTEPRSPQRTGNTTPCT
nr:oxidoreductase andh [Quercus suber]